MVVSNWLIYFRGTVEPCFQLLIFHYPWQNFICYSCSNIDQNIFNRATATQAISSNILDNMVEFLQYFLQWSPPSTSLDAINPQQQAGINHKNTKDSKHHENKTIWVAYIMAYILYVWLF